MANKRAEGLAINPDGRTLVVARQSPLIQDGGTRGNYNADGSSAPRGYREACSRAGARLFISRGSQARPAVVESVEQRRGLTVAPGLAMWKSPAPSTAPLTRGRRRQASE